MSNKSRRSILGSIGLITTTGVIGSASGVGKALSQTESSPTVEETDWPTYRGNPGRTGSTVEEAAPNGEYAQVAWEGASAPYDNSGGAIVAGGLQFYEMYDRDTRTPSTIAARDVETGEQVWKHENPTEFDAGPDNLGIGVIHSRPTAGDGRVYVSSKSNSDGYGGLHALDIETGDKVWARSDGGGTLTYVDGVLCDSDGGYDPATGEALWDGADGSVIGYEDDLRYGQTATGFVAHDVQTGTLQQSVTFDADPYITNAAIVNGTVYCVWEEIYAISLDDGTEEWRWSPSGENASQNFYERPAIKDGTVIVTGNNPIEGEPYAENYPKGTQTTVYALDAATGEVQWTKDILTRVEGNPTIAGDTVYLGGHAFSEERRDYHNRPYVARRFPTVQTLSLSDGSEQWSHLVREQGETTIRWAESPVVADGHVFVNTTERRRDGLNRDRGFYVLEASDTAPDPMNVPGPNSWLFAKLTSDPENAGSKDLDAGSTVTLDASESGGEIEKYEWQVGGGSSYDRTGEQIDVSLDLCGELRVRLRVTGPDGRQTYAQIYLSTT